MKFCENTCCVCLFIFNEFIFHTYLRTSTHSYTHGAEVHTHMTKFTQHDEIHILHTMHTYVYTNGQSTFTHKFIFHTYIRTNTPSYMQEADEAAQQRKAQQAAEARAKEEVFIKHVCMVYIMYIKQ